MLALLSTTNTRSKSARHCAATCCDVRNNVSPTIANSLIIWRVDVISKLYGILKLVNIRESL